MAKSQIKIHQEQHDTFPTFDHTKHDPNCRYCRRACVQCEREWQRMPAEVK